MSEVTGEFGPERPRGKWALHSSEDWALFAVTSLAMTMAAAFGVLGGWAVPGIFAVVTLFAAVITSVKAVHSGRTETPDGR